MGNLAFFPTDGSSVMMETERVILVMMVAFHGWGFFLLAFS